MALTSEGRDNDVSVPPVPAEPIVPQVSGDAQTGSADGSEEKSGQDAWSVSAVKVLVNAGRKQGIVATPEPQGRPAEEIEVRPSKERGAEKSTDSTPGEACAIRPAEEGRVAATAASLDHPRDPGVSTASTVGAPTNAGRDSGAPAQEARAAVRSDSSSARMPEMTAPGSSPLVNGVQISDRAGQSEMHIGLRTSTFGTVEVHAVVHENQVGLAIASERGDLHRLLASEVPTIEGRLQHHDLRLDVVRFFDQGMSFDAGMGSGADPRARSNTTGRPFPASDSSFTESDAAPEPEPLQEMEGGLNVRA